MPTPPNESNNPRDREQQGADDDDLPDFDEIETGDIDEGKAREAVHQKGDVDRGEPRTGKGKGQEPVQPDLERDQEREP